MIAGGGDSALDWTLNLQPVAERITLVHHRDGFRAAPHSVARMKDLAAQGAIDFVVGKLNGLVGPAPKLDRRFGDHRTKAQRSSRPIACSRSTASP